MLHVKEDNGGVDAEEVGMLIALAYPERIAKAINNISNFKMANGKTVFIDKNDSMSTHKWLAIASLNKKVFLSAPVNIQDIETTELENISWDSKAGTIKMQREHCIGTLVVDTKRRQADRHRQPLRSYQKRQPQHVGLERTGTKAATKSSFREKNGILR